jgi:enhancing lycopene biosynthesis protein 2
MKKVAVLLAGCGVMDGAEINETVLTLLALDKANACYQCVAPNRLHWPINHLDNQVETTQRNILVEAARIVRGEILPLDQVKVSTFDALIVPGGFGVAKNFSDFAKQGAKSQVEPDIAKFIQAFRDTAKPVGLLCIAPVLAPKLYPAQTQVTVGNDPSIHQAMTQMGAQTQDCMVTEIVIDKAQKLVTTPAYMLAQRISEAAVGIERLVEAVLALTDGDERLTQT